MVVEYRLVTVLSKDEWKFLGRFRTDYAPREGERCNVNGNPFIVYEVAGVVRHQGQGMLEIDDESYVFVNVFKAGDYFIEGVDKRSTRLEDMNGKEIMVGDFIIDPRDKELGNKPHKVVEDKGRFGFFDNIGGGKEFFLLNAYKDQTEILIE